MIEEFREIEGTNGRYSVSNMGNVRSNIRNKLMKIQTKYWGHKNVQIRVGENISMNFTVHRLVALAFLEPPSDPSLIVCHNDGDPSNNCSSNLRWDTPSSNRLDAVKHGTDHNASKTHCKLGHVLLPGNLVKVVRGHPNGRSCLTCSRAYAYARLHPEHDAEYWASTRYYPIIMETVGSLSEVPEK